jgi:hypothetical protein
MRVAGVCEKRPTLLTHLTHIGHVGQRRCTEDTLMPARLGHVRTGSQATDRPGFSPQPAPAMRWPGWPGGACAPGRSTAALRPRPLADTKRQAQIKRSKYFVRLYSPSELSALMRRAGFQSVQAFGQDGEAYSLYGKRLILVASKV